MEIPLTQGKSTIIDDADADRILKYRWNAVQVSPGNWYASSSSSPVRYLHRFLLDDPDGIVDHINHDGLDNRRSNLRIAERNGLNIANARFEKNAHGYRGVYLDRRGRKRPYGAQIKVHRKHMNLGYFATAEEAARAYDAAARKHFGEYANTNF